MTNDNASMGSTKEKKDYGSDIDDEEKKLDTPSTPTAGVNAFAPFDEQPLPQEASKEQDEDDFTVKWEENDPLNPRTRLSYVRKWVITFIIAGSSICV